MAGTTQDVLTHHLACFGKGDLDGIMADYTPASRLFTPNGVLRGTSAIRELFVTIVSEFSKPGMSFEMLDASAEQRELARTVEVLRERLGQKDRVIARVTEEFVKLKKNLGSPERLSLPLTPSAASRLTFRPA